MGNNFQSHHTPNNKIGEVLGQGHMLIHEGLDKGEFSIESWQSHPQVDRVPVLVD